MAASWEPYFANALEVRGEEMALGPDEPKDPKQWRELDPLTRGFLESQDRREVFDDWLGWTYVSWRRLARRHRYQARVERALVSTANSRFESYSNRTGRIYSVAVGERYTSPDWRHYLEAIQPFGVGVRLCALLYSDVLSPMFVDSIQESEVWADAGIKERAPIEHDSYQIIAIPRISFMRLRSVSATPTMSSAPSIGHHIALQVGKGLYGQSAAGVLTSGSAAMFVDRTGHNDPCLLGARHVFGPTGSSVVDAAQNSIGSVSLDDLTLDASVVDLTAPWVVDYRLPGLN